LIIKSLLTSLLRQAQDGEHGEPFVKGPAFRGIWQRGERGDFIDDVNSILSAMNIPMRAE